MKYDINAIRRITEEHKIDYNNLYEIFIRDYILRVAKLGRNSVKVKSIHEKIINMLEEEGYKIVYHSEKYEQTYDGICTVPGTAYYEIRW